MRSEDSIFSGQVSKLLESLYSTENIKVTIRNCPITEYQRLGIQIASNYAFNLTRVEQNDENWRKIMTTLPQAKGDRFMGIDWFSSSIYIMMLFDIQKTEAFLSKFKNCTDSIHIWYQNALQSDSDCIAVSCHWIEQIVYEKHPSLYAAFQLSGNTMSQVSRNNIVLHQVDKRMLLERS
jgi:hypothetical protein